MADVAEPQHRLPTTLVLSLAAVGSALIAIFGSDDSFTAVSVVGALAGLVPWALIAGGVRVPVAVFAAASLSCAALVVLVAGNPGGLFPVMLTVVWVARSSDDRRVLAGVLTASLGLNLACAWTADSKGLGDGLAYFAGGIGISFLSGRMLHRQEALTAELQEMNELRVEHAAAAERSRIARDVHDVVAHSLTVVMLHVTGARRVLASDPGRADEALERAESVGRDSLDSIRQVMGLLREPGSGADVPVRGLADVAGLIDGGAAGGLAVDADLDVAPDEVDQTVGLVVYRIVQESLTNVLRHAPGSRVDVRVRARAGADVEVEVVNGRAAAAPSADGRTGLGVRGMSERVRALSGRLEAGPTGDGGWRVRAVIPARGGVTAPTSEGAWPEPILH